MLDQVVASDLSLIKGQNFLQRVKSNVPKFVDTKVGCEEGLPDTKITGPRTNFLLQKDNSKSTTMDPRIKNPVLSELKHLSRQLSSMKSKSN